VTRSDCSRLFEGAFAGNIFDLGAAASAELYDNGGVDFAATVEKLKASSVVRRRFRRHAKPIRVQDARQSDRLCR
jgi:type II pantothenate kinase